MITIKSPLSRDIQEWLHSRIQELYPAVAGVGAEHIEVIPLTGDASNRKYFRVISKESPLSAILMVKGVPEGFKASEEKTGRGENEPPGDPFLLIARMLSRASLPVPEILGENGDASLLLQEDLGDASLYSYLKEHPEEERSLSFRILDLLLAFGGQAIPQDSAWLRSRIYSEELLFWEFEHFLEYGVSITDQAILSRMRELFREESMVLSGRLPRVPVHRDFHSRNIMISGRGPVLIDFQDMLMGSPLYDLASWVFDAYRSLPEDLLDELVVAHFHRGKTLGLLPGDLEEGEHRNLLARMALQRNMKACGRFFYIRDVKGNPGYMGSVSGTHENMKRLARWEPSVAPLVESFLPFLRKTGL
ncbi:MAG: aminoglycoside phosphotransferase family protein [Leptospirillum sp.]